MNFWLHGSLGKLRVDERNSDRAVTSRVLSIHKSNHKREAAA